MGFETALALASTAAGLAGTVGGTIMQGQANKSAGQDAMRATAARNAELQEYRKRMQGLSAESRAASEKAQGQFKPEEMEQRTQEAEKTLGDQYQRAVTEKAPLSDIPLGGSAPEVTAAAANEAKGRTDAYTSMLAQRLAKLGATGQGLMGSAQNIKRAGSNVDMLSNFGRQETALLPQYQDFATTGYRLKPQGSTGGQLLTGLGGSLLKYGGSKLPDMKSFSSVFGGG